MFIGETLNHVFSIYPNNTNPLRLEAYLNETTLSTTYGYFLKLTSTSTGFICNPLTLSRFGKHTLKLRISDGINYLDHVIEINVRNRAPYFKNNITNLNYTSFFKNSTSFALP